MFANDHQLDECENQNFKEQSQTSKNLWSLKTHIHSVKLKPKNLKRIKTSVMQKKKKNTNVRLKEKNEDNPKLVNVIQ